MLRCRIRPIWWNLVWNQQKSHCLMAETIQRNGPGKDCCSWLVRRCGRCCNLYGPQLSGTGLRRGRENCRRTLSGHEKPEWKETRSWFYRMPGFLWLWSAWSGQTVWGLFGWWIAGLCLYAVRRQFLSYDEKPEKLMPDYRGGLPGVLRPIQTRFWSLQ